MCGPFFSVLWCLWQPNELTLHSTMCNKVYLAAVSALIVSLVCLAHSQEARDNDIDGSPTFTGRRLMDCLDQGDFKCVKLKVLSNLDKILRLRSFKLMDGVLIEKEDNVNAENENTASDDDFVDARNLKTEEDRLDVMIISKIARLFKDRSLKLDIFPGLLSARLARSHNSDGLVDVSVERGQGGGGGGFGGFGGNNSYYSPYMLHFFSNHTNTNTKNDAY